MSRPAAGWTGKGILAVLAGLKLKEHLLLPALSAA